MTEGRRFLVAGRAIPVGCRRWRRAKVLGPDRDVIVRGAGQQWKARLRNRPLKRGWARQASDPRIASGRNRAERRVDPDAGASAGERT
ncbi:MAG: hypothetical protein CL949_05475 [Erythrobacter sp.]|nr:hypothetical protein [Erythrobacter sp.]